MYLRKSSYHKLCVEVKIIICKIFAAAKNVICYELLLLRRGRKCIQLKIFFTPADSE